MADHPKLIGDLRLGDRVSDGETLCTGCWDNSNHDTERNNDIPAGYPIYWTSPSPEYGECDPYCRKCAEERDAHWSDMAIAVERPQTGAVPS